MRTSGGCPRDRSELLAIIDGDGTDELRTHVEECERCGFEIEELRGILAANSLTPDVAPLSAPPEHARRKAVAYALSRSRRHRQRFTWTASAATVIGALLGGLVGAINEARVALDAPQIDSPDPLGWALIGGWAVVFFFARRFEPASTGRNILEFAIGATLIFVALVLVVPMSTAVNVCAALTYGNRQLSSAEIMIAYAVVTTCYAMISASAVAHFGRYSLSWHASCLAGLVFVLLTGPILLPEMAASGAHAAWPGLGGLGCGAWLGSRLGKRG